MRTSCGARTSPVIRWGPPRASSDACADPGIELGWEAGIPANRFSFVCKRSLYLAKPFRLCQFHERTLFVGLLPFRRSDGKRMKLAGRQESADLFPYRDKGTPCDRRYTEV
jgi:hypothetical protein